MIGAAYLQRRGYNPPPYRSGDRCPCCHAAHWTIGRFSAECVGCGAAVPLASRGERRQ